MRADQITQLSTIEEQLVDLFVQECKTEGWPGMERDKDRGDRYWHKKNALATLNIVARIQNVLRDVRRGDGAEPGDGKRAAAETLEENGDSIEREAAALMKAGRSVLKRHGVKH